MVARNRWTSRPLLVRRACIQNTACRASIHYIFFFSARVSRQSTNCCGTSVHKRRRSMPGSSPNSAGQRSCRIAQRGTIMELTTRAAEVQRRVRELQHLIVLHNTPRRTEVSNDIRSDAHTTSQIIRRIIRARAAQRRHALRHFFEAPAWDMLLDLEAARLDSVQMYVTAVCASSGATQSTALRKLAILEAAGLVQRYINDGDRRRVCLRITDQGSTFVRSSLHAEHSWQIEREGPLTPEPVGGGGKAEDTEVGRGGLLVRRGDGAPLL